MTSMEQDYRRDHDAQMRMRNVIRAIDALLSNPHRVPPADRVILSEQRNRLEEMAVRVDGVWD